MVHSVTFPTPIGGDGSTVTDDSNPTTGLANGGHRKRLVPMFSNMISVCQFMITSMANSVASAAASAITAINAPGTAGTSATSVTIPGSTPTDVSMTTQVGKSWAVGQWVIAASTADIANNMIGQIKSYLTGTGAMVITVRIVGGSGAHADWNISLTAAQDSTLTGRTSALETEATRMVARRRLLYKEIA